MVWIFSYKHCWHLRPPVLHEPGHWSRCMLELDTEKTVELEWETRIWSLPVLQCWCVVQCTSLIVSLHSQLWSSVKSTTDCGSTRTIRKYFNSETRADQDNTWIIQSEEFSQNKLLNKWKYFENSDLLNINNLPWLTDNKDVWRSDTIFLNHGAEWQQEVGLFVQEDVQGGAAGRHEDLHQASLPEEEEGEGAAGEVSAESELGQWSE